MSATASTTVADLAFDVRDALGEGPAWDEREQALYWVDLLGKKLFKGDPRSGQVAEQALPYAASRVTLCDDASLLVSFLRRPAFGTFGSAAFDELGIGDLARTRQRFNDGACDSHGRFWTAVYDGQADQANGQLLSIDSQGVQSRGSGIRMPNGIRWSPDERTMYFVDSWPGRVFAFEFDVESARLGARRLLIDFEGSGAKPDGCVVDLDGCLWIAEVNRARVARYTPDGRLDRVVEVPTSKPTSVSFGGAGGRTLYITSRIDGLTAEQRSAEPHAGAVFAAAANVAGLPEHRFRRAASAPRSENTMTTTGDPG